jgi:asparagine synthase (glutamine-hydrolysing)
MMRTDTLAYLPDDILVKVDRASMSLALELRVPILDHRIVEFAWSLPVDLRASKAASKVVLRTVLYRYVPEQLMNRPKMGFAAPIGNWLRTDLRPWAEALLCSSSLAWSGLLNVETIRRIWRDHLSGLRDCSHEIWSILAFQMWLDSAKESLSAWCHESCARGGKS